MKSSQQKSVKFSESNMDLDVFVLEIGTNWNSNIETVKNMHFGQGIQE